MFWIRGSLDGCAEGAAGMSCAILGWRGMSTFANVTACLHYGLSTFANVLRSFLQLLVHSDKMKMLNKFHMHVHRTLDHFIRGFRAHVACRLLSQQAFVVEPHCRFHSFLSARMAAPNRPGPGILPVTFVSLSVHPAIQSHDTTSGDAPL